jgi:hypothetical protein
VRRTNPSALPSQTSRTSIHLLRFETAGGLEAVRRDPEMAALAPLRREIVGKALLLRVDDVPLERYFKPG